MGIEFLLRVLLFAVGQRRLADRSDSTGGCNVTYFLFGVAIFLLATLLASLRRILKGPTPTDRMLAAQLFGSTGVAIVLVLGEAAGTPGVTDVALVFAILAAVNAIAFVQHPRESEEKE